MPFSFVQNIIYIFPSRRVPPLLSAASVSRCTSASDSDKSPQRCWAPRRNIFQKTTTVTTMYVTVLAFVYRNSGEDRVCFKVILRELRKFTERFRRRIMFMLSVCSIRFIFSTWSELVLNCWKMFLQMVKQRKILKNEGEHDWDYLCFVFHHTVLLF